MSEQSKSEAPQLTEIAAQVFAGLLASGDYTKSGGYSAGRHASIRPEALTDAVTLAKALIALTKPDPPQFNELEVKPPQEAQLSA